MIKFSIISLFLCNMASAQDYVAKWKTRARETGVVNYQVQYSADSLGNYITLKTVPPTKFSDTNFYAYTLPALTNYYKIKALMIRGAPFYTKVIKVTNINVKITSAVLKVQTSSDNLSFNAANELAVDYYLVERTNNNGNTWVIVGKLTQKNAAKYVVNISKSGANRKYRVTPYYKTGYKGPPINFT